MKDTRTGNLHFLNVQAAFEKQTHTNVISDSKITKNSISHPKIV